jgi:MscS family membrane protein
MDFKALTDFVQFHSELSKQFLALLIFFGFMLLRFFFTRIIVENLKKIIDKTKTDIDNIIVDSISRPLSFLFIAVGIFFAKGVAKVHPTVDVILNHTVQSMFIFAVFWVFYNIVEPLSGKVQKLTLRYGKELSHDLAQFLTKTLKFIIVVVGIASIFQEWGYNVGAFLASLGLIGMAFALAAKDTAANLFGSLVIFIDRPFKIGDWIMTPDVEGIVEEIGVRSTRVRTFANALVTVPNAVLANSAILNWSKMKKRRINMTVGLTYSTTESQMRAIVANMKQMLKTHEDIHQETIYIYFTDFNDSSLGIFCYFFTKSTAWDEYMRVREDVNLKIMKIVEDEGASFAFPSQSIYVENQTQELLR